MNELTYLPYKAINVFIERNELENMLLEILEHKNMLKQESRIAFDKIYKQQVSVLGFRNATRAPLPLQVKAYATAFEEKDEIIPITLSTWTRLNEDFAENVKECLDSEGWKNLSMERTFNEEEGFTQQWPENLSLDDLAKKFKKAFPQENFNESDFMLMVFWISGKLPPDQSVI